jgi:hypothetical protein
MCAVADAARLFPEAREVLVVSLGTGSDDLRRRIKGMWGSGKLSWALPILGIMFDASSDTVDYEVAEIADNYFRFQESNVSIDMDDASQRSIAGLLRAAENLITTHKDELRNLASELRLADASAQAGMA